MQGHRNCLFHFLAYLSIKSHYFELKLSPQAVATELQCQIVTFCTYISPNIEKLRMALPYGCLSQVVF